MNNILNDLKKAINSIDEFYYEMPHVVMANDKLKADLDEIKRYERRFVAQLKSEYDKLISEGVTGNYEEVRTDLEVIKKYIYYDNPDSLIVSTYQKISQKENKKAFDTIVTIPDFFIHKQQDNNDKIYQKLAVEVKTTPLLSNLDFFLDLFKLNVYVEKYNFQNGVYLIMNNPISDIRSLVKDYMTQKLYIAPNCSNRIYLFVKPSFKENIKICRLVDMI